MVVGGNELFSSQGFVCGLLLRGRPCQLTVYFENNHSIAYWMSSWSCLWHYWLGCLNDACLYFYPITQGFVLFVHVNMWNMCFFFCKLVSHSIFSMCVFVFLSFVWGYLLPKVSLVWGQCLIVKKILVNCLFLYFWSLSLGLNKHIKSGLFYPKFLFFFFILFFDLNFSRPSFNG